MDDSVVHNVRRTGGARRRRSVPIRGVATCLTILAMTGVGLHFISSLTDRLHEATDGCLRSVVALDGATIAASTVQRNAVRHANQRSAGSAATLTASNHDLADAVLGYASTAARDAAPDELRRIESATNQMLEASETLAAIDPGRTGSEDAACLDTVSDSHASLLHALGASLERHRSIANARVVDAERVAVLGTLALSLQAVGCLAAVFLAAWIARTAEPVRRLCEAIQHLADPSEEVRVSSAGLSDLDPIAGAINDVASRLNDERSQSSQRIERLTDEIARRSELEQQLRHDAARDALTGLPNRARLVEHLDGCILRAQRDDAFRFALLFIDLDDFKIVNDGFGHQVGDELLMQVAERLLGSVRGLDTVVRIDEKTTARLGGDEFAVLLDGISNPGRAGLVADRILANLSESFSIGDQELRVGASIGIAIGGSGSSGGDTMIRHADIAMYRAKLAGGGRYALFDDAMHDEVRRKLQTENDLRQAVELQQLDLLYQPILDLREDQIIGFEALIRWHHPERGMVSPADFVPLAEESRLILDIGRWALRTACAQLAAWQRLPEGAGLRISVNVSPRQVTESDLVAEVEETLRITGVKPEGLRLEITESMIIDEDDRVRSVLGRLQEMGVELHLDDFGTGYSSLSCLHRFPIDVLKIDREFVASMQDDPQYAAVVQAIMTLAHNLKMRVTAEGIETPGQLTLVRSLGCDYGQGHIFSRPVAPAEAWSMVVQERRQNDAA